MTSSFRTDIQGLRALAVLSVVIYHISPKHLIGGFVGVDIFFVISGYLIIGQICNQLSTYKNIILLCGHYKGVDQRIREHLITREISVSDYVLTGGELGSMIIVDSIIRLIPGVISDETSALSDSFQDGLLSPPIYTRPSNYNGWKVPEILLSGNEKEIEKWKQEQAEIRTKIRRPDILKGN